LGDAVGVGTAVAKRSTKLRVGSVAGAERIADRVTALRADGSVGVLRRVRLAAPCRFVLLGVPLFLSVLGVDIVQSAPRRQRRRDTCKKREKSLPVE
jgi:hypothetical protein